MESRVSRALRYRNKADLVNVIAEAMGSSVAKSVLQGVVQDYVEWAETLEEESRTGAGSPDMPNFET